MSCDKENLRDLPCEKKFDNSIITSRWSVGPKDKSRDNKTVTIRDLPCENKPIRKFDNSGQKENSCEKTVTLRDSPCEEKFDNSQIRDKNHPCEKTVTSATIRVKSKHDIPREEHPCDSSAFARDSYGSIALHSLSSGTPAETSTTVFETGCTNSTLRLIRDIDPSGLLRGAPYFKSPFMGHPIAAS